MTTVKNKTAMATRPTVKSSVLLKKTNKNSLVKSNMTGAKVVKAKIAKMPLAKQKITTPIFKGATLEAAMDTGAGLALTKSDLQKRQQAKTTKRKQGNLSFGALTVKQSKTMANLMEAAPTSVE
jgi:hypothetical protein